MNESLSYDDVLLIPQYSDIESRKDVDISTTLGDIHLELPVVASPMDTICEREMAVAMAKQGGLGILHRYNTIEEQVGQLCDYQMAAAIGVTGDYLDRAKALRENDCWIFCIDVAHGHHTLMKKAIESLRNEFGEEVHIMAGNVATAEGTRDLVEWGANSVRVGIGGGSICTTRIRTGHGIPNISSIMAANLARQQTKRKFGIIADGGVKNSGDIVKALAAGADAVIVGSLLSGTKQTPGEMINLNGKKMKKYRGMASAEAQQKWRGYVSVAEGVSSFVPYAGNVDNVLSDIKDGIASGYSYSGARTTREFQEKSIFTRQTSAGAKESSAHIRSKA